MNLRLPVLHTENNRALAVSSEIPDTRKDEPMSNSPLQLAKRGLKFASRRLGFASGTSGAPSPKLNSLFPEATNEDHDLLELIAPFTFTPLQRQFGLLKAIRYINNNGIRGDIVECGVWRGGNIMLAKAASRNSLLSRRYYLFDTFAGMSAPGDVDIAYTGEHASVEFSKAMRDDYNEWCYASRAEVERNFAGAGLLGDDIIFCQGDVEETLKNPSNIPEQISLLRLDTDWYASTKIELEVLYPRVVKGGVIIIDDYGHWEGARRAVDEYFGARAPLLIAVDLTCRFAIKV